MQPFWMVVSERLLRVARTDFRAQKSFSSTNRRRQNCTAPGQILPSSGRCRNKSGKKFTPCKKICGQQQFHYWEVKTLLYIRRTSKNTSRWTYNALVSIRCLKTLHNTRRFRHPKEGTLGPHRADLRFPSSAPEGRPTLQHAFLGSTAKGGM